MNYLKLSNQQVKKIIKNVSKEIARPIQEMILNNPDALNFSIKIVPVMIEAL